MAKHKPQSSIGIGKCLAFVRAFFPAVDTIEDALDPIMLRITRKDMAQATPGDPMACAIACAGKRAFHADGVIVGTCIAYVIKGNRAIRYEVRQSVARLELQFDKDEIFPAVALLSAVMPGHRLGRKITNKSTRTATKRPHRPPIVVTRPIGLRPVLQQLVRSRQQGVPA